MRTRSDVVFICLLFSCHDVIIIIITIIVWLLIFISISTLFLFIMRSQLVLIVSTRVPFEVLQLYLIYLFRYDSHLHFVCVHFYPCMYGCDCGYSYLLLFDTIFNDISVLFYSEIYHCNFHIILILFR